MVDRELHSTAITQETNMHCSMARHIILHLTRDATIGWPLAAAMKIAVLARAAILCRKQLPRERERSGY